MGAGTEEGVRFESGWTPYSVWHAVTTTPAAVVWTAATGSKIGNLVILVVIARIVFQRLGA
jgi:hypothetical protein